MLTQTLVVSSFDLTQVHVTPTRLSLPSHNKISISGDTWERHVCENFKNTHYTANVRRSEDPKICKAHLLISRHSRHERPDGRRVRGRPITFRAAWDANGQEEGRRCREQSERSIGHCNLGYHACTQDEGKKRWNIKSTSTVPPGLRNLNGKKSKPTFIIWSIVKPFQKCINLI